MMKGRCSAMFCLKRFLYPALLMLLMLVFAEAPIRGVCEKQPTAMTLMVYMCGSNLETDAGLASRDLQEMMAAMPSDGSLEILVLAAGSTVWQSDVDAEKANIYRLTPAGLQLAEAHPSASMGDPDSLSRLLRCGWEHCPAERYALLLWDHGAGPMMGVCFDERYPSAQGMDSLSLTELRSALLNSPFAEEKLAWIGFDACLMATAETACAVAPFAEYMIASQELEPPDGWCYDFLSGAARHPDGAETGRLAVDMYAAFYADSLSDVTLSCIDLSQMENVSREMTALFGSFSVDTGNYAGFALSRSEARRIGGTVYDYDLVDFMDLLEVYGEEGVADCGALRDALAQAIVCSRSNCPFRNGLSLYYPFSNKSRYTSPWSSQMDELPFSEGYRAFIRQTSAIWLGESLADWSQMASISADTVNSHHLMLQLTPEQLEQFAGAHLLILAETDPGIFRFVYMVNNVDLRGDTLNCTYSDEALFVVDEKGEIQSSAIYYTMDGDDLCIRGIMCPEWKSNWSMLDGLLAKLYYRKNSEGFYAFASAYELSQGGVVGKSDLKLEDYNPVILVTVPSRPTVGNDGRLLPFSEWEFVRSIIGDVLLDYDPKKLAFLPLEDGEPRWALFEITDLQGSVWTSDMISLPSETRIKLPVEPQTLLDCEVCTITLESAEISLGANPMLELIYSAVNHTDESIVYSMDDFMFDDTMVTYHSLDKTQIFDIGYSSLEPGESKVEILRIQPDAFRNAFIQTLNKLTLTTVVSSNYSKSKEKELGRNRAEILLQFDARALVPNPRDSEPMDSAVWNGIRIELMSIEETQFGKTRALVRFVNPGDQEVHISWKTSGFKMNDEPVSADFETSMLELPAHCNACQWLSFYNRNDLDQISAEKIQSISILFYAYDDNRYDLNQRREIEEIRLEAVR